MFVQWGQRWGVGVALNATTEYITSPDGAPSRVSTMQSKAKRLEIKGLVLETPFMSVRAMLVVLYPQKWLPYWCLYHALGNHWNGRQALGQIASYVTNP